MRDKIKQLKKDKEKLTLELKEWVKDKSIPLDERWEVFFASDLGKHSSWIEDFVNLDSDDVASHRDMDRSETVDLQDIRAYGISSIESDEDYDAFREDVLTKFIKSFEWDW